MATKLKVGVTTLLALVILVGGIMWLKQYNPMAKRDTYNAMFSDANGIAVGDPVNLAGIKVGDVQSVALDDQNRALISFSVSQGPKLYSDARFAVRDIGLMGDKALVIYPGSKMPLLDSAVILHGEVSASVNDLIIKADQLIGKLTDVSTKIDQDLDISGLTSSFEETLAKLTSAVSVVEEIASENRQPIKKAIGDIESSAGKLDLFIENSDNRLGLALESFTCTSDKLSDAIEDLSSLSSTADTLSYYIGTGEGSLGRLIKSGDLYEELRQTNAHIDSFISDFKTNPGKYTKDMQFKIRLF